ncbi:helix-turn-helix domain-containing protein [Pedobacter sp. L105]|uniref:winged helix-turn-helix transcriptional regulator n=1 Tax=Pedobacter sp. L105 TaxID=1641871 RepID=UPI00131B9FD8|nr:helix-turn-helix domain-containing protein [Pedobacter sp. L105]
METQKENTTALTRPFIDPNVTQAACNGAIHAVKDALYVLNGKWKLPLIVSLMDGPKRFNEIQRALGEITPKILSKELRELELNEFVLRKVFSTVPVTVTYELTPYSGSLSKVLEELRNWGTEHRERIVTSRRQSISVEK